MKPFIATPLAIAALLSNAPFATAASIANDNFESYTAGNALSGGTGGSGWTGGWSTSGGSFTSTVVATTLSYSKGAVSSNGGSNALELKWTDTGKEGNTSPLLARQLGSAQTGTVYLSFLFRDTVDDQTAANDNFTQWGFDNSNDGNPNASILREAPTFRARTGTAGSEDSGITSGIGVTRLLVFKAEKTGGGDYNKVSLFVDPSSLTEGTADIFDIDPAVGTDTFNWFMTRTARHNPGDTFQIDNILIGSTWSDVVIPEPSSAALLGLAAGLGLLRRRRK